MFHYPEHFRHTNVPPVFKSDPGRPGPFMIPSRMENGGEFCAVASSGEGWEHVSVHVKTPEGLSRIPTWDEMCFIKSLFWDPDDCVVQYHPPRSQYVDRHKFTLHLWRPIGKEIPLPPKILV